MTSENKISDGGGVVRRARGRLHRLVRGTGSFPGGSLPDLEDAFDLDGNVVGECSDANSDACVTTRVSEDLYEEVGCAIHDLRLTREVRSGVDVAGEADAAGDATEIAVQGAAHMCDEVESTKPSSLLALIEAELTPQFAYEASLAVPLRELAGKEEESPRLRERHVVGAGRAGSRQLDAECFQVVIEGSAH